MHEINIIKNFLSNINEDEKSYVDNLNNLSEPKNIIKIVDFILSNKQIQHLISNRSYTHSNGFFKIIVYKSMLHKLRIHIWYPNKNASILENIHFHRWYFASKLLFGEYKNFDYEINKSGVLMNRYIYLPRKQLNTYTLIRNGYENLLQTKTTLLTKGQFLISKPMELHRVIPNRNIYTSSLLLQGPDELNSTLVYNEFPIEEKIKNPSLTIGELCKVLDFFGNQFIKLL